MTDLNQKPHSKITKKLINDLFLLRHSYLTDPNQNLQDKVTNKLFDHLLISPPTHVAIPNQRPLNRVTKKLFDYPESSSPVNVTDSSQNLPKRITIKSLVYRFITVFISSAWVSIGYLLLLSIAEFLVAMKAPQLGLILHCIILTTLLLQSSFTNQIDQRRFLLALSLAPLIRMISLLMPFKLFPTIYWYAVVAVPLFVAAFLIARTAHITRQMTGMVLSSLPMQLLVGLSGIILGFVEYVILRPAPLIPALRWDLFLIPALILFVFTGFLEELIFRGLLQSTALPFLRQYAIPYIAGVFAVLHLGYRSVPDFVFVFGVALFFGYIVKRSGSIVGVTIAHGLINILLFLVFPFLR
jgi:membrane protease YdiL (CAAX protease family)